MRPDTRDCPKRRFRPRASVCWRAWILNRRGARELKKPCYRGPRLVQWFFPADHHIGELTAGEHERERHGPHRAAILIEHALHSAPSLHRVALQATAQTLLGSGRDVNLQIEKRADLVAIQR